MIVFKRIIKGQLSRYYYVKFVLDKKQVLKSTGLENKKQAESWARNHVAELRSQKSLVDLAETVHKIKSKGDPITLNSAVDEFLKIPRKKKLSDKTVKQYHSYFGDFVQYTLSNKPHYKFLQDVTRDDAVDYLNKISESGRFFNGKYKCEKVSNRTYNAYLNICKMIFEWLKKKAGIRENPFDNIPWKETKHVSRDVFSKEELALIGKTVPEDLKPLFIVALYTGLRRGDICTLTWKEVNMERGEISKIMSKTGNLVNIPILSPLYSYLKTLDKTDEYVFPELYKKSDGVSLQNLSTRVTKFLNSIGIENSKKVEGLSRKASTKDIHSLRHTFVWLAAEAGVPLTIIQSVVGHLTKEMTERYANHATIHDSRRHLQFLENYLNIEECQAINPLEELDEILNSIKGHAEEKKKIKDLFSQAGF